MCCNFHETVQCYGQMLHTEVTLRSNFVHLATSLQTALVTRHNLRKCYITVLCYMSVPTFRLSTCGSIADLAEIFPTES